MISYYSAKKIVYITTFYGLIKKFPAPDVFQKHTLCLRHGMTVSRDSLINSLDILDYISVEMVTDKGEYAIRGDIFEVFPLGFESPFRIEFIDDTIEDISLIIEVFRELMLFLLFQPLRDCIVQKDSWKLSKPIIIFMKRHRFMENLQATTGLLLY